VLERFGFNALGYRPFRTFFLANFVGNSSWFVFNAGFGWLVLAMTGSAATVGLAFFVSGLPAMLLTLHAGLLTDRFGARPLVALSFALTGLIMIAFGLLALSFELPLWVVLLFALAQGTAMTLGAPGYTSIVNDLVPPGAVSSAVALNFVGISVGRIVGGLVGGLLVATFPAPWAVITAGIMQALPAIPVWRLPTPRLERAAGGERALLRPLLDALAYAVRFPTLGVILLLAVVPGTLGLSYNYMIPVAARDLGIGGEGLGALLAMAGAGGLVAGFLAESTMRRAGHGRAIFLGLWTSALGMLAFGLAPVVGLSIASMIFVGGGFVIYSAASLTLIQALSPAAVRGRTTSVFALLYWGFMPLGGLLGGIVAEAAGARTAFAAAGLILLVSGVVVVALRRQVVTLRVDRDGRTTADGVVVDLAREELASA
jgi:MFS family permease